MKKLNKNIYTDVCVIGAGPAGSCCALGLAKRGYDVCLVESAPFPRHHVGESLTSGILPLLEQLDIRQRIENAGFYRPNTAFLQWGTINGQKPRAVESGAFQVVRAVFDNILLDEANKAGVKLLQPVTAGLAIETTAGWRIPVKKSTRCDTIFAKKLVIATGRKMFLKTIRTRLSPAMLAIYAYRKQNKITDSSSRIEAFNHGWLWAAPLPNGLINIAVCTDPNSKCFSNSNELHQFYRRSISESKLLASYGKSQLVGTIRCCDATSYITTEPAGNNWIYIGDAALSIDPLSSQGVQVAIKTAILASSVLHTQFNQQWHSASSVSFYTDKIHDIAHHHQLMARQFYTNHATRCDTEFWRKRSYTQVKAHTKNKSSIIHYNKTFSIHSSRLKLDDNAKLISQAALIDGHIENRKALHHPNLDRPVVFIQNIELAPLIQYLEQGNKGNKTSKNIILEWSRFIGLESSYRILFWLLKVKILRPVSYLRHP